MTKVARCMVCTLHLFLFIGFHDRISFFSFFHLFITNFDYSSRLEDIILMLLSLYQIIKFYSLLESRNFVVVLSSRLTTRFLFLHSGDQLC